MMSAAWSNRKCIDWRQAPSPEINLFTTGAYGNMLVISRVAAPFLNKALIMNHHVISSRLWRILTVVIGTVAGMAGNYKQTC